MDRNRRGFRNILSSLILLACGCASDPAARMVRSGAAAGPEVLPARIFASIDEAAVAALSEARATASLAERKSIRLGSIREEAGGYTWVRPKIAAAGVQSSRPAAVRFALSADDVATFIVHPASGESDLDRANERLSASEKRLLEDRLGRARPVYLLTPRLDVVRHTRDEASYRVASLRSPRRSADEGLRTAARD